MVVRFRRLYPDATPPTRATEGSAGWDLTYGVAGELPNPVVIHPRETVRLGTGIAIELPPGYEAQFRARSSLAKKGLLTVVGTIDSDYRGELMAAVTNVSHRTQVVISGDRVGQIVIHKLPDVEFIEADELDETERGAGGWGSTGP